ncbi:MAG: hypothetical protein JSU92_04340, partial [Deltaproteobacteria bacterium]
GTCEERLDGGAWQACNTGFVGVGDGNHDVDAQCTDTCGNVSALATSNFDVDTVAPAAPTITSPADGSTLATSNVVTDITCAEGTCEERLDSGAWQACSTGFTAGQGPHTIDAQCTDTCGNTGPMASVSFYVDIGVCTPDAIVVTGPASAICEADITISLTEGAVGCPGKAADITCSLEEVTTVSYDCGISQVARTSGGTVTESGCPGNPSPPGEDLTMAFDDNVNTKWLDFCGADGTSWIQYQYGGGAQYKIKRYSITSANDAPERDPRDWELQGSNDGVVYDTLDTRAGIQFTARFQTLTFDIADGNVAEYEYYRLWITALWGPAPVAVQLAEIELYECAEVGGSSYTPLPPPVEIGGGDYQTNASVTSPGPATVVCVYSGTGGPLSDNHLVTFVAPSTVTNIDPLPDDYLGPADDVDPGTPGMQISVSGSTDAPDGEVAAILVDGVTQATPLVSGGIFSATITIADGVHTLIERVVMSCGTASVTKQITVDSDYYAVIVGDTSGVTVDTITVGTGGSFDVMVYGAVLVGDAVSPTESLGSYQFVISHQVVGAPTMTLNSIVGDGTLEFDGVPGQIISNSDDGGGYADSLFFATNDGDSSYTGPMGFDIPLAVLNFTAGGSTGTTTIYIDAVEDYISNDFVDLDRVPLRALTIIVQ